MSIVIFHRGSTTIHPYDRWLAGYKGEICVLASQDYLDAYRESISDIADRYAYVESFAEYDSTAAVEEAAHAFHQKYPVEYVLACQEMVQERAARLREQWNLPGQRPESIVAFRDKFVMKRFATDGGVPVATHALAETPEVIRGFAAEHGFPIVIKPRAGAGSIDVRIIRSAAQLDEVLGAEALHFPHLLVEKFVPGTMYHVDGLVVDGRAVLSWPSVYRNVLAEFKAGSSRTDVTLEPADPLTARLVDFTDRVVAALPGPPHYAFHAEIFHTPDDELVLCEIASRAGGAAVKEAILAAFGVDLTEQAIRAQVGLPISVGNRPDPGQMAGQLLIMKRPGTVRAIPPASPFPWVTNLRIFAAAGDEIGVSGASSDVLASMIVTGPDRATCEARLTEARDWFDAAIVID